MTMIDLIYVLLSLAFVAVIAFMTLYNRRVRLTAQQLRRKGVIPHSIQEEILLAERVLSPQSHPGPIPL